MGVKGCGESKRVGMREYGQEVGVCQTMTVERQLCPEVVDSENVPHVKLFGRTQKTQ